MNRKNVSTYAALSAREYGLMSVDKRDDIPISGGRIISRILGDTAKPLFGGRKSRKRQALVNLLDDLASSGRVEMLDMARLVIDIYADLAKKIEELKKENKRLRSLTLTDPLTGLYNTRFFATQLEIEMARTKRTGLSCSLMMIDLDNFKTLNDTMGHVEGNQVLLKVANVMRENLRPTETVCRYGGDEFTIIMPATDLSDALKIADRLRLSIPVVGSKGGVRISASIGLISYSVHSTWGPAEFVDMADKALYLAKRAGKNRVATLEGGLAAGPEEVTREEREALWKKDQE